MNNEKISILIPVFNRENLIKSAIKSILGQTYTYFDLIIFNDGSTDKTIDVIKSFNDSRIQLIGSKTNVGVPYARNKLLEACNTKYACWQDSDDRSNIYRIEYQYHMIKRLNRLCFCQWTKLRGVYEKEWLDKPHKVPNKTKAFATLMFPVNKAIRFNEKLIIGGEDWEWVKQMTSKYGKSFSLPERLYYVRFHDNRIGVWKRKIRKKLLKELILTKSYSELIEIYNKMEKESGE